MINSNSRYANCSIEILPYGEDTRTTITGMSQVTGTFGFIYYQVVDGDTIDDIAFKILGDGTLWWKVADLNPEIIDFTFLDPGTVLRIPSGS